MRTKNLSVGISALGPRAYPYRGRDELIVRYGLPCFGVGQWAVYLFDFWGVLSFSCEGARATNAEGSWGEQGGGPPLAMEASSLVKDRDGRPDAERSASGACLIIK